MKHEKKRSIHIKIPVSMGEQVDSIFAFHGGMTLAVNRGLELLIEQIRSGKLKGKVPLLGDINAGHEEDEKSESYRED